jgi:hypothetical protein
MLPIVHTAAQLVIAAVGMPACGTAAARLSNRPWLGWLVAAIILVWHHAQTTWRSWRPCVKRGK